MGRYKIIIQYDGSIFNGWQFQKESKTVQGEIENALKKISGYDSRIPVHGSGRTDTGVHAKGQVAHFDMNTKLGTDKLRNAINANISNFCRVMKVLKVNNDFHSRFDAKRRFYRYQIYNGESLLYKNQAWLKKHIDIKKLNAISKIILGKHDFLSFSKFRPNQLNTECEIYTSEWVSNEKMTVYNIVGNRFLHHMVRYLVGTIIKVAEGLYNIEKFKSLLNEPRKNVQIYKAPPNGLILARVDYE